MPEEPRSGEIYRHFKDRLYQIITVALHSETGERLVIYQALYGDYRTYARPLEQFFSEVDHLKYPDVTQKHRFERAEDIRQEVQKSSAEEAQGDTDRSRDSVHRQDDGTMAEGVNPKLMAFLDADDLEEKYQVLISMRDEVNDHLINNMAVVLDVVIPEGEIGDRYEQLKNCIKTKQRYETDRIR